MPTHTMIKSENARPVSHSLSGCTQAAGVPTVPGSDGLIKDDAEAVEVSRKMGFPIMIKATAGGGGRGMRLAMTEKEFLPLLQQAAQVRPVSICPVSNML